MERMPTWFQAAVVFLLVSMSGCAEVLNRRYDAAVGPESPDNRADARERIGVADASVRVTAHDAALEDAAPVDAAAAEDAAMEDAAGSNDAVLEDASLEDAASSADSGAIDASGDVACADSPCFDSVECRDLPTGGVECGACPVGTRGDGRVCTNFDACAASPCFANVVCVDDAPPSEGYSCGDCPTGWEGDGTSCVDVDGCAGDSCFATVVCTDVPAPGTGFSCGECPAGYTGDGITCVGVGLLLNEVLAEPSGSPLGDANCDGVTHPFDDKFVEVVNVGPDSIDLTNGTLWDRQAVRHVFLQPTVLAPGDVLVIFGGGSPIFPGETGRPWCTPQLPNVVVRASNIAGGLSLNEGGDTITIRLANGTAVLSAEYGDGSDQESLVRVPDLIGSFQRHSEQVGAVGPQSPGRTIDGASLAPSI